MTQHRWGDSEPHTILARVYFAQREGGCIKTVPANSATRDALAACRYDDDVHYPDVLTAQVLWDARVPSTQPARA